MVGVDETTVDETEVGDVVGWTEGEGRAVADGSAAVVGAVLGVGAAGCDVLVGKLDGAGRA